jgi:hypothetical protein
MARAYVIGLLAAASYLVWTILVAFGSGSMFDAGARIAAEPWGWVTLVDLYLGFLVVGGLIVWRERRVTRWLPWIAALFFLGNLVSALYVARWLLHGSRHDRTAP